MVHRYWQPEPLPNRCRDLGPCSAAGILPRSWSHYTVPAGMTVIQWVSDFSERIKQLQNISQAAASGGAKELKVGMRDPGKSHRHLPSRAWVERCPCLTSPFPGDSSLYRASMCAWEACLCLRPTSLPPDNMWPKPTAGLWRSFPWKLMSQPPRVPPSMPAALGSQVSGSLSSQCGPSLKPVSK